MHWHVKKHVLGRINLQRQRQGCPTRQGLTHVVLGARPRMTAVCSRGDV